MKRMYIKPEICVEEVVTEMLATSGGGTESGGGTASGGTINPDNPAVPAANSQRDGWGNLWGGDK